MVSFSTAESASPRPPFALEGDVSIGDMILDEHHNEDMGYEGISEHNFTKNEIEDEMTGLGLYMDGGKGHSYFYHVRYTHDDNIHACDVFSSSLLVPANTHLPKPSFTNKTTTIATTMNTSMSTASEVTLNEGASINHQKLRPPPAPRLTRVVPVPSSSPVITPWDHPYQFNQPINHQKLCPPPTPRLSRAVPVPFSSRVIAPEEFPYQFSGPFEPISYIYERQQMTENQYQHANAHSTRSRSTASVTAIPSIYYMHKHETQPQHQRMTSQAVLSRNTFFNASTSLVYGNTDLLSSPSIKLDTSSPFSSTGRRSSSPLGPGASILRKSTLTTYSPGSIPKTRRTKKRVRFLVEVGEKERAANEVGQGRRNLSIN